MVLPAKASRIDHVVARGCSGIQCSIGHAYVAAAYLFGVDYFSAGGSAVARFFKIKFKVKPKVKSNV